MSTFSRHSNGLTNSIKISVSSLITLILQHPRLARYTGMISSASSCIVFKSGLRICNPLQTSVGIDIFPVTTRLLGRFNSSTVDTSSSNHINECFFVCFFVTVRATC